MYKDLLPAFLVFWRIFDTCTLSVNKGRMGKFHSLLMV